MIAHACAGGKERQSGRVRESPPVEATLKPEQRASVEQNTAGQLPVENRHARRNRPHLTTSVGQPANRERVDVPHTHRLPHRTATLRAAQLRGV
ncbi:MAG: hypothetical protein ACKO3P_11855 [Planctomycetaceae bacterium]